MSNSMSSTKQNPSGSSVQPNDTIYLCNFRVSVDGEWLCLKVSKIHTTRSFTLHWVGSYMSKRKVVP